MGSDPMRTELVREARLELARLAALEPKSSASTNSATLASGRSVYQRVWIQAVAAPLS